MEIIPAIDLKEGRCVRLYQGDYQKETIFCDDPVEVALRWQSLGASRLHIVDLDGAAAGEPRNVEIIKQIARAVLVPTEVGGGIRNLEMIVQLLKDGVERVVLGTVAVEDRELVAKACYNFGEAIVVGVDARDSQIAIRGWQQQTKLGIIELVRSMIELGVKRFIYTDICRDGTLTEPNFTAIFELVNATCLPVIASGGVSSINHLIMLKKLGVEGAIVGKALYTGDINLKQALNAIS